MGRGVLINRYKGYKSGPTELIVGGVLQPGYEAYINKPTTAAVADTWNCYGGKGDTSAWTSYYDIGQPGGTNDNPLTGYISSSVRIDFTPKAKGKTCTITWSVKAAARIGKRGYAQITGATLYYNGDGPIDTITVTSTFDITQENFYFFVRGYWDGWTTGWWPTSSASVSYLALD